jgi:hypothetical protein
MTEITNTNETADVRKLATIAKIEEIKEIPDALAIEHVRIRGWWVVAQKGLYKVGDLCIYAEVDSVFPDGCTPEQTEAWRQLNKELSKAASDDDKAAIKQSMKLISDSSTIPEFEFLRSNKFRIKTKRIFGEISMGIVFPITLLNSVGKLSEKDGKYFLEIDI